MQPWDNLVPSSHTVRQPGRPAAVFTPESLVEISFTSYYSFITVITVITVNTVIKVIIIITFITVISWPGRAAKTGKTLKSADLQIAISA